MRTKLTILLFVLAIASCHKEHINKDTNCTADCTTVNGTIFTTNNVPLVEIPVNFKSFTGNMLGSQTRIIKDAQTNNSGFYIMNVHLNDKELTHDYMLSLNIDLRHLDPEEFLLPKFFDGYVTGSFDGGEFKLDTTVNASIYIPKKEYITINLKNYIPVKEKDVFQIEIFSPWGWKSAEKSDKKIGNSILNTEYDILHTGMDDSFIAKNKNQTFRNIPVAPNEMNIIRVIKVKNGVASAEEAKIFVPEKNNIELNFEY